MENKNNVIDLELFHRKKIITQVEELRNSNYSIIRLFPRFDDDDLMEELYQHEQNTQLVFLQSFDKNKDPCCGFFCVEGFSLEGNSFLSELRFKSTLNSFFKCETPGRDRVILDKENTTAFPVVVTLEYLTEAPDTVIENPNRDKVNKVLNCNAGTVYFASIVCLLLKAYPDMHAISVTEKEKVVIVITNEKEYLRLTIDTKVCDTELNDFYKRNV